MAEHSSQRLYFRRAIDVIEKIDRAEGREQIGALLAATLAQMGYPYYCFATPYTANHQTLSQRVLMIRWPNGWAEHYEQSGFVRHDVVAATFRSCRTAFRWSELKVKSSHSQKVMKVAAQEYCMKRGFCVPIHGLTGYQAGLSVAGEQVDDCNEANSAIELLAIYAFNKHSRLTADTLRVLTQRESEVVAWTAAGKTAWDTSVILSISVDTVNKTMASAMRRLNVHTRAQAVAEAMRRREINL